MRFKRVNGSEGIQIIIAFQSPKCVLFRRIGRTPVICQPHGIYSCYVNDLISSICFFFYRNSHERRKPVGIDKKKFQKTKSVFTYT